MKRLMILLALLLALPASAAEFNSGRTFDASSITTGTVKHERGGLEADVSAYSGLVKISGGSTSAVTDNSANWNNALLSTGTDNVKDTHVDWGTGAAQVSADDVPDGSTNIIPTATQETNWGTAYSDTNAAASAATANVIAKRDANGNIAAGFVLRVTPKTSSGAVAVNEAGVVTCAAAGAGDVTLTLPDAAGNTGITYIFKDINATHNCIIDGLDADTLDGAATYTMTTLNEKYAIVSDGSNWLNISGTTAAP